MFLILYDTRPSDVTGPPDQEDVEVAFSVAAYQPLLFPTAQGAALFGAGSGAERYAVVDLDQLEWRS